MRKRMGTIFFYGHSGSNGKACLSNFYPAAFVDHEDSICYSNTEQYLMYHKAKLFGDMVIANQILSTTHPSTIKALGRKVKGFNDTTWDKHKYNIMCRGLYYKFSQNDMLGAYLLSTGDATLAEASPTDRIWGIGMSEQQAINLPQHLLYSRGQNLLGQALMSTRDRIRSS